MESIKFVSTTWFIMLVYGCSSPSLENVSYQKSSPTVPMSSISFDSDHSVKEVICENDNASKVIARYQCINNFLHKGRMYLSTGNAANSLLVLKEGVEKYPYEDRLKNLFQKARSVFVKSTIDISKESPLDCDRLDKRRTFISQISPDTAILKLEKCKINKVEHKKDFNFKSYRFSNNYDLKNLKQFHSAISYHISKSNEDNYEDMAMLGIASLSNIIQPFKYFNFKIRSSTRMKISVDLIGSRLIGSFDISNHLDKFTKNFHFKDGTYVNRNIFWNLKVGNKNKLRLKEHRKFTDILPRKLVVSLNFYSQANELLSKNYYLSDFIVTGYSKEKVEYKLNLEEDRSYSNFPERYSRSSPIVHDTSRVKGLRLSNVNIKKIGDFSYAVLVLEPDLTYEVYKHTKGTSMSGKWRKVLRKQLLKK